MIQTQQSKIEKVNINNNIQSTLLVGPPFSGKTYLMLKLLSPIANLDSYTISKSRPEQYTKSKIKIKETNEEIKPLKEFKKAVIVFDETLGSSNSRYIDQFLKRKA